MVGVVTGNGLGLSGSSLSVLGAGGQLGVAGGGQGGDAAYVNAKTGNLILQRQDELLVGMGPDIGVARTYNSNATFDFDNNDGWQLSLYRKLSALTGTVNTAGSTITRTEADGAQQVYSYTSGQYTNRDGGGAYDTLTYTAGTNTWTWTDGSTQTTETYDASPTTGEWRIARRADTAGYALVYRYDPTSGLITECHWGQARFSFSKLANPTHC